MCFTAEDADLVAEKLDLVLTGTSSAPFAYRRWVASLLPRVTDTMSQRG